MTLKIEVPANTTAICEAKRKVTEVARRKPLEGRTDISRTRQMQDAVMLEVGSGNMF